MRYLKTLIVVLLSFCLCVLSACSQDEWEDIDVDNEFARKTIEFFNKSAYKNYSKHKHYA